jgi:stearoyl-CoA 9-desaturase NADPH oxidoreductase
MTTVATRLVGALVWPRTLDDLLELWAPLHSSSEIRARVVDVVRETHDVSTLVLEPNGRWRGHRAGQHVMLTAEIDGVRRTRCFSISSPEGETPIRLTIKAQPRGRVTPALVSGALRGEIVTLEGPRGDFVLPDVLPERILFLSGGSGVTPMVSMVRTLLARGHRGRIAFAHWARSPDDVVFDYGTTFFGHFRAGDLVELVPDFHLWDTWLCGPDGMMRVVQAAYAARGAEHRVRTERFVLAPSHHGGGEGEVRFLRSKRSAKGKGPILPLAEAAGVNAKSGCRMGICRSCVCRKVSGTTRDVRTGELSSEADVDIQLCINAPVGAVEIDL